MYKMPLRTRAMIQILLPVIILSICFSFFIYTIQKNIIFSPAFVNTEKAGFYLNQTVTVLVCFNLLIIITGLLSVFYFSRAFLKPIQKLSRSAKEIAKGTDPDMVDFDTIPDLAALSISIEKLGIEIKKKIMVLKESEARLKIAGKAAYDLIYEWDCSTDAIEWFGDVDGLLGFRQGEISRDVSAWLNLIHPDDLKMLENAVEVHKTNTTPILYEYRVKHKNGSYRYWKDHALPLLDQRDRPYKWVGVCSDITASKELELHRLETKKMETIGTLAGGIAHDFNNVLFSIKGFVELAMEDIPENSLAYQNLDEVLIACGRAQDVVNKIMEFSSKTTGEKQLLKLSDLLEQSLSLLEFTLPQNVKISKDINNIEGMIMADKVGIHQIVMNLASNAYDAMTEQGGVLEFILSKETIGSTHPDPDLSADEYFKLTVRDTGCGMERNALERIFDPYFSTKDPGKASGMGLSVVYGLVKDYGGAIKVSSNTGEGSVFEIFFPKAVPQIQE